MKFKKTSLTVAFAAFSLLGCQHQRLGEKAADPALKGVTVQTQNFAGAAPSLRLIIDGKSLEVSGRRFFFHEGTVEIKGDVPPGTWLRVFGGRLIVNGNIGSNSKIDVYLPEKSVLKKGGCTSIDPTGTIASKYDCQVRDGLLYPDDPVAISVTGSVDARSIDTNGEIAIGGCRTDTGSYQTNGQKVTALKGICP